MTKAEITTLADKYETPDFLDKDPSKFMHNYEAVCDAEVTGFIAANLAFGRREQILSHIEIIIELIKENNMTPCQWLVSRAFEKTFDDSPSSFYRMYSYGAMRGFFEVLAEILEEWGSLGTFFENKWKEAVKLNNDSLEGLWLHHVIADCFPKECCVVSHGKDGAAKKLNMFLRWMVRDNSPVDLGLWRWYPKSRLLMPLDTHVMQQAVKFGLLKKTAAGKVPGANLKTALQLSLKMSEYFPDDPVRGDFALFGLGVNSY